MLQTQSQQAPHNRLVNPRDVLATKIRKFIDHCHIVSEHSTGNVRWETLNALDQIKRTLYPMAKKPENYTTKDICQFTLIAQIHLRKMLPSLMNNSYKSSLQSLEDILTECKSILKKHEQA
jgi:hypothetical protein